MRSLGNTAPAAMREPRRCGSCSETWPDADENRVLKHASVHGGVMCNGDPVAHNDRIKVALAMENGAVLDVGVGADADGVDVATQNGVHPHRRALAEGYVADQLRGRVNIATSGDQGRRPGSCGSWFQDLLVKSKVWCAARQTAPARQDAGQPAWVKKSSKSESAGYRGQFVCNITRFQ